MPSVSLYMKGTWNFQKWQWDRKMEFGKKLGKFAKFYNCKISPKK
jgi:hypothetical protein